MSAETFLILTVLTHRARARFFLQLTRYINYLLTYLLKWQNRLKVGTNKPKLKVKMRSVSDDDVRKRLLEVFEIITTLSLCCVQSQSDTGTDVGNGRQSTDRDDRF